MSSGFAVETVAAPPSVPRLTSPVAGDALDNGRALEPLIAEYSAIYGPSWKPATARKHRDDFARFLRWLAETGRPATTTSLDFLTLAAYVTDLRRRPRVHAVWRGSPDAVRRSQPADRPETLSANTINAYMRPLRSLAIWLVDEELLTSNPFRRSRRRAALNPLLPAEDTPTKGATLEDLQALGRGCAGGAPLDLRDRAIVAVLVTTAARNSSVRLLRLDDVDLERGVIHFVRAKGDKTLEVALQPSARAALEAYLAGGRPGGVKSVSDRRYRAGGGSLPYFGSHRIRHATATFLVNNGMPLEEVSRYLGHCSTEVTRRYARHTTATRGDRAAEALARAGVAAR
jgi:integrase/recombinase XerC